MLPFWLFFLIALYLYFVPLFQAGKLAVPFFVLLITTYVQAPDPLFIIVFGAVFYFLLLIKDLLLIDRRSAHELLVLVLSFLLLRDFYMAFPQGISGAALWYALFTAILVALLARNLVRGGTGQGTDLGGERMALWLIFSLVWQATIVGLFLPLDFVYQMLAVFLVVILVIDLIPDYLFGTFERTKALTTITVVLILFAVILGSAQWGL
ncbi:MAG TPA: hypothetical protein VHZ04_01805 [Candidatus Paceibacterota bacterium]|nr:hypothetical protein [Candidatus Paceibacterota bacterium]